MLNHSYNFTYKTADSQPDGIYQQFIDRLKKQTGLRVKLTNHTERHKVAKGEFVQIPELFIEAEGYSFEGFYITYYKNSLCIQKRPSDFDYLFIVSLRICYEMMLESGGNEIGVFFGDSIIIDASMNPMHIFEKLMLPIDGHSSNQIYETSCKKLSQLEDRWSLPTKKWVYDPTWRRV